MLVTSHLLGPAYDHFPLPCMASGQWLAAIAWYGLRCHDPLCCCRWACLLAVVCLEPRPSSLVDSCHITAAAAHCCWFCAILTQAELAASSTVLLRSWLPVYMLAAGARNLGPLPLNLGDTKNVTATALHCGLSLC